MKAVLQRVSRAAVRIIDSAGGYNHSAERIIDAGLVVLLGVAADDDLTDANRLVDKVVGLRVFSDEHGKMNLSVEQVRGQLLVVSQFTLMADTRRGRRPSFAGAANPVLGRTMYEYVVDRLQVRGLSVVTGDFGATMQVELVNDGPVTIVLDTREA